MRPVVGASSLLRVVLPAWAALSLLAVPARADEWSAWEALDDGQQKRIYLRSYTAADRLGPDAWRLKNGYSVPVQVEVQIVDHEGDAPAQPDAHTQVARRTLRPGQIWNLRTTPTVSVSLRRLEILTSTPAPRVSTHR